MPRTQSQPKPIAKCTRIYDAQQSRHRRNIPVFEQRNYKNKWYLLIAVQRHSIIVSYAGRDYYIQNQRQTTSIVQNTHSYVIQRIFIE